MAGEEKTFSSLGILTGVAGSDRFALLSSGNNYTVNTTILFSNSNVDYVTNGNHALSSANLIIRYSNSAPANSTSNGIQGQFVWDSGNLYLCVANNSWIRFTGSNNF